MASSEEQSGSNAACAQSSDVTDTPEKLIATQKENYAGEIDDEHRYTNRGEIDILASDHTTASDKGDIALEEMNVECNEFSTKTWKNDLTVIVEGKQLYVSSSVLALVSPVFSSMLESAFKKHGPRTLELTDNFDDFVELLRCIYPGITKPVTKENALTIVSLAHKYQVENVANICKTILLDMVCDGSTLASLTLILNNALVCQLTSLGDKCMHEIMRRNISDSELSQLEISPAIRQEMKTAKVRYLEEEVQTLKQHLQQKGDRCDELEYLVTKTWVEDLKITNSSHIELHLISVNVSDNRGENVNPVCFKYTAWALEAEILDKRINSYSEDTKKELSVILSAKGDVSWREWRCKVKASCSVFDGVHRAWQQTSEELGSSRNQLKFSPYCFSGLDLTNPLKVSVIFAVGDITV